MTSDFFSELGSIVGVGVGTIELQLMKRGYTAGEVVHGRTQLRLSRPIEAKRLVAAIEATRKERVLDVGADGRRRPVERSVVLYRLEHELDGKRSYHAEAYDIHIPIPREPQRELPKGGFGEMLKLVSAVQDLTRSPLSWRVHVFLDVRWKANVKTHADIAVA